MAHAMLHPTAGTWPMSRALTARQVFPWCSTPVPTRWQRGARLVVVGLPGCGPAHPSLHLLLEGGLVLPELPKTSLGLSPRSEAPRAPHSPSGCLVLCMLSTRQAVQLAEPQWRALSDLQIRHFPQERTYARPGVGRQTEAHVSVLYHCDKSLLTWGLGRHTLTLSWRPQV